MWRLTTTFLKIGSLPLSESNFVRCSNRTSNVGKLSIQETLAALGPQWQIGTTMAVPYLARSPQPLCKGQHEYLCNVSNYMPFVQKFHHFMLLFIYIHCTRSAPCAQLTGRWKEDTDSPAVEDSGRMRKKIWQYLKPLNIKHPMKIMVYTNQLM